MTTTGTDRPAGVLDRNHASVTVGAVALITFLAFESLAVTTAMPAVADALDGITLYALAFGAPLATAIAGMVLSGSWSDAHGPARPLTTGAALFVSGLGVAGFSQSMTMVAVGRGIQGLGSGLVIVALYVLVARVYAKSLRPQIFAAFAAAWVLPALVGPTISGFMVEHAGWRWVFLSVAALVPLAMVLIQPGLQRLRDDPTPHGRPATVTPRLAWAVSAGVAAALLHMATDAVPVAMMIFLALGIAGVALSAPRLLPSGAFTGRPGLPSVVALRGLAGSAFLGAEVFLPLLLVRERGLSPTQAGIAITVGAVTWSMASWLQGRGVIADRRMRLRVGMTCVALGIVVTGFLVVPGFPIAVGIASWALGGFGMGLVYPTLSVLVLELSSRDDQGRNSSSLQIADSLFTTLTLAVTGTIFAALLAYSDTWPFLAGFAVTAMIATVGVGVAGRTLPRRNLGVLSPPAVGDHRSTSSARSA